MMGLLVSHKVESIIKAFVVGLFLLLSVTATSWGAPTTFRVDAMVTGNHEYDFGQEALRQRIREARFPVLTANVNV